MAQGWRKPAQAVFPCLSLSCVYILLSLSNCHDDERRDRKEGARKRERERTKREQRERVERDSERKREREREKARERKGDTNTNGRMQQ